MHFIWTLLIGLVVGAIAKLLMPGRDPGGIIVTILLGVAGAFIGTLVGQALNLYDGNEGAGLIVSVIGAVILLAGYRAVIGRGSRRQAL